MLFVCLSASTTPKACTYLYVLANNFFYIGANYSIAIAAVNEAGTGAFVNASFQVRGTTKKNHHCLAAY